ncbi:hypothetical protein VP1G_06032 [Cytospora mali]|uniref:Uncharacterized protein n=1 Tax=Cytospora mali TaxID=578113 RepID=A0A194V4C5_CYTMA|nr:hypothetical protein VP1G_06032 [Valsa mali var. pyri (nom. inval.)]
MAEPLSSAASAHFSNLSLSSITTGNFVPSSIYCVPSSIKSTRNTVHWDKNIFDSSIKGNAVPDARNKSPSSVNAPGSLRTLEVSQQSQSPVDFGDRRFRGHQRRPPLDPETFIAPDTQIESTDNTATNKDYYLHDLVKAARDLDPNENVFEKHKRKHFQWVLSLPASAGSNCNQSLDSPLDCSDSHVLGECDKRYFGCNLLTWTKPPGKENRLPGDPEDKYLLLATPIDLKPDCSETRNVKFTIRHEQFRSLQQNTQHLKMAATQMMDSPAGAASDVFQPESVTPQSARSAMWSTAATADASEDSDNTLTLDSRREMKAPLSTIEDSLEELDDFEDEVEALTAATRMTHITDPQDKRSHMTSPKTATKTTPPANRSSPKAQGSTRNKPSEPVHSSSVHKPSPLTESNQDGEKTPGKAAPTRKVARPASLAPPKPLQKTSKPPTVSTFELPGERVARELKERKAARLSMQLDPQKLAELSSPPQRSRSVRSSKPPTIPNFELPGETFSRMKRERLAAKLKAEEEEAARRRQFKARPPPSSVVSSSTTVRSTFTSRQRESQAGPSEQQQDSFSPASPSPKSGAAKRQSVTMTPSLARTASAASASSVSTAQRGRTSSVDSSHLGSTRATSSSNGSVVSGTKRRSLTAEEIQQQKIRGRNVYLRDNSLAQEKEREKRERQQAIALARQKYAEQSRMLATSRRLKQQSSTSTSESRGD